MSENHTVTILLQYFFILISCYFIYINIPLSLFEHTFAYKEIKQIEMLFLFVFSTIFWGFQLFSLQSQVRQNKRDDLHQLKITEALIQNSSNVLFHLNSKGAVTFISAMSEAVLGYNQAELLSRPFSSLFYDIRHFDDICEQLKSASEAPRYLRSKLIRKNGSIIWAEIRTIVNEKKEGAELQGCIQDISEQQAMLTCLQGEEQILNDIVDHIPYIIFVKNNKNEIVLVNKFLCNLLGINIDELKRDSRNKLLSCDSLEALQDSAFEKWNHGEHKKEIVDQFGETHEFEFSQIKIANKMDDGLVLTIGKTISSSDRRAETVEYFLQYDSLTGLLNRNVFINQLEKRLTTEQGHESLAVCVLDLYDFKRINDTLGHDIGDQALKYTAQRISMMGEQLSLLCRYNCDEFAFILNDINSIKSLNLLIKRLHSFFEHPLQLQEVELKLAVNIGIVLSPNDGLSTDILLKKLDIALHVAKSSSSTQTQIYSGELEESLHANMRIEKYLSKALTNSELSLAYQPFVSNKGERLIGAEVLLRWYNDQLGQVSPEQFIPVAEQTGEIVSIGSWIINQACLQLRTWQKRFGSDFYLAVNVSPRQFLYGDLVNVIDKALTVTGINPSSLEIEITEGLLLGNQESVLETMQKLVKRGVRLSLDDFGTGYSSLNYLKKFPFACLKIDRAFISDLNKDQQDEALVVAITEMAHALKLSVVAEGVEKIEQLTRLQALDVDIIQGYYFSKPLSDIDFENWSEQRESVELAHLLI